MENIDRIIRQAAMITYRCTCCGMSFQFMALARICEVGHPEKN